MMPAKHALQKTMRTERPGRKLRKLYILVMGLTGAGKSTFISVLTENKDIPISKLGELSSVTQVVEDYILLYQHDGRAYEIHLIDSPGFDDDALSEAEILSKIADYVNTNYKLKKRLAGVLYLHDITKDRMGGVGNKKIRVLEKWIGLEKFNNCTIVTTKWGCTTNPEAENARENTLRTDDRYFASMLQSENNQPNASMRRFDPKSKSVALDIIKPYLDNRFVPHITDQMVNPKGPKLPLGETEAGKVVSDNVEMLRRIADTVQQQEKLKEAQEILSRQYDESLFREFKVKRKELLTKIRLQRTGRWIVRTTIVGGAIAATVLTLGPGASSFVLAPMYERAVRGQRREEKLEKVELEKEFRRKSQNGGHLKSLDPSWLWNSKVESMEDLSSEGYSIGSSTGKEDILGLAKRSETVGLAADDGESINLNDISGADSDSDDDSGVEEAEYSEGAENPEEE